jgi:hypothetical protein
VHERQDEHRLADFGIGEAHAAGEFLVDQFKVVTTNMRGEPVLPTDEDYAGVESP